MDVNSTVLQFGDGPFDGQYRQTVPETDQKAKKKWSKYIKGACGIFARYACKRGIVRVLTLPPYWAEFIRPQSTYRNIEEPVLKGKSGCCGAVQINAVSVMLQLLSSNSLSSLKGPSSGASQWRMYVQFNRAAPAYKVSVPSSLLSTHSMSPPIFRSSRVPHCWLDLKSHELA
jgi:hypothetical protein